MQLALFEQQTVASPRWMCMSDRKPCRRNGRAVYGEPEDRGECVNRTVRCLTCGCTGEESTRSLT